MGTQANIIENIYKCFSTYSTFVPFDGSPYKKRLIEEMNISLTKDIRSYNWSDDSPFSNLPLCIIWTIGDSYQYKRFLPRVLELAITEDAKNNYYLLDTSMYLDRIAKNVIDLSDEEKLVLSSAGGSTP